MQPNMALQRAAGEIPGSSTHSWPAAAELLRWAATVTRTEKP